MTTSSIPFTAGAARRPLFSKPAASPDSMNAEVTRLGSELTSLTAENSRLSAELQSVTAERDRLRAALEFEKKVSAEMTARLAGRKGREPEAGAEHPNAPLAACVAHWSAETRALMGLP